MIKRLIIIIFLFGSMYIHQTHSQTPDFSGDNFIKDGAGNIVNLTNGIVYKDIGDGTLLNLNSGELYKKIADGTIIRLETEIKVPINIKQ